MRGWSTSPSSGGGGDEADPPRAAGRGQGDPGAAAGREARHRAALHRRHAARGRRAGTPVGQKAKDIMARGDLVPDDVVDRSHLRAARRSRTCATASCSTAFRAPSRRREALDRLLAEKGLELDAVIELKVDEGMLLQRIERRLAEMQARGRAGPARRQSRSVQDAARGLSRADRAARSAYYRGRDMLKSVDGMAEIDAGRPRDR